MIKIGYEQIREKIKATTGLNDTEIEEKVGKKMEELSDLVSKEGAAHIIANELGVKLFEDVKGIKIKDVLPGMLGVELNGKVTQINEVREFSTEKRSGKVASFLLGDETGTIRVVLWDNGLIKEIEDGNVKENMILQIKDGNVRDNNGFTEIHLGNRGRLILEPKGVEIGEVKTSSFKVEDYKKKQIKDLDENDVNVGIFGTVVQLFEPRFFESCSECGKRLKLEGEKFICDDHKDATVKYIPVLNLFFDDGTENIRAVAFRDRVNEILGLKEEDVADLRESLDKFEDIRKRILGNQVMLVGRVTKNEMFNRLEFVIQRVLDVKPEDLVKELEK